MKKRAKKKPPAPKSDEPLRLEYIDVEQLADNPANWRTHPGEQLDALTAVMDDVGWAGACLWNSFTGRLIDGHARKKVSKGKVPVLIGSWSEEEERKILATLDPLAALAEADEQKLGELLANIETEHAPLRAMLDGLAEEHGIDLCEPGAEELADPEPQIDRAAELQAEWGTELGQLWTIEGKAGTHRLLCGDSTKREDVERVCDGTVNGCFTSPPYAEQRKEQYGGIPAAEYVDWWENVQAGVRAVLAEDGSFFVNIKPHCEDGERVLYVFDLVLAMRRRWGWRFVDELCWYHGGVYGRYPCRFKNGFEPVYHFARGVPKCSPDAVAHKSPNAFSGSGGSSRTGSGYEQPDREAVGEGMALPSNVIQIRCGTAGGCKADHPAQFPPGLPSFFIKAFSDPGDVWLDVFMGSGTTLVACEQLGRVGVGLELSAPYCAVICQRMKDLGLDPQLAEGGT